MSNDNKLLGVEDRTEKQDLPAGCFSSWLRRLRRSLIKENGVDVPCGDCNACCKSSYFIHIRPEETQTQTQTLTRIPRGLLFAAPGLPMGNVLLGYDEHGRCPMLIDDQCSIYEHRPQTCRNYDCRIFTAAGIAAGDDDKALITGRIRYWKFSYPTKHDRDQHAAVQAAAMFLREHAVCFPAGVLSNSSQLAILAIKVYDVFLKYNDESGKAGDLASDIEIAKVIMETNEKFEARRDN
jgi:Fe-S-cluster containining protein